MTDSIAATKILVDTNILIYAADLKAGDKNLKPQVLPLTGAITLRALDAIPRHGFSFWDGLIWAVRPRKTGFR